MKLKPATMKKTPMFADVGDYISNYKDAVEAAGDCLIGRDLEMKLMMVCSLSGGHLFFCGPHGIVKTLAGRRFLSVFEKDVNCYFKQIFPQTREEELFGPVNVSDLRNPKASVWRVNTHRMLPEAHIALLDELYRGEHLLSATMGLLNEGIFVNGGEVVQCPLRFAVGTTNFVIKEDRLLAAFADRWLVQYPVKPLEASLRLKLAQHYLAQGRRNGKGDAVEARVSLGQFDVMRLAAKHLRLDEEAVKLVLNTVGLFSRKLFASRPSDSYISDRRICKLLNLVQAAALLELDEFNPQQEYGPDDIAGALAFMEYGLVTNPDDPDVVAAASAACAEVIGDWVVQNNTRREVAAYEKAAKLMVKSYTSHMKPASRYEALAALLQALSATVPAGASSDLNSRFDAARSSLYDLGVSLVVDLNKREKDALSGLRLHGGLDDCELAEVEAGFHDIYRMAAQSNRNIAKHVEEAEAEQASKISAFQSVTDDFVGKASPFSDVFAEKSKTATELAMEDETEDMKVILSDDVDEPVKPKKVKP